MTLLQAGVNFSIETIVGVAVMGGFTVLWFLIKADKANTKERIDKMDDRIGRNEKLIGDNRNEIDKRVTELHFNLLEEFTKLRERISQYNK